ncbi:hypothetical protein [Desulfofalx alkaliphila]|uniref:hypothetical protein n=1 Tax=Desulfofalx alkaliphila TaxID=105483 RepID=UPI0012FEC8E8|nr:hypothetical protein [Desulfofalx alkaliphila]
MKSKPQQETKKPLVSLTVQYSKEGNGLNDAYKLLSKKVLERRLSFCKRQSISG